MTEPAHVATLTLNPALDVATATEEVRPIDKLRCEAPRYDPGGGGINVARVVCTLGGNATAVYPAGGPAGAMLRHLLDDACVRQRVIPIAGVTRESFTVDEQATGQQFRFVLPGPALTAEEQTRCLAELARLGPPPPFLVVSGSLPPGVPPEILARLARIAHEKGARLVVDTSGEALRHAAGEGVFLMKPNLRELSSLCGRELGGHQDQAAAAGEMIRRGAADVIVLSLGAEGALLVTAEAAERLPAIEVPVASAVGAGDSMVGGLVLALARGWPLRDAVRFGMAAGAATLMTEGTELCRRDDVERLYRQTYLGG